jgi:hypothetical protein
MNLHNRTTTKRTPAAGTHTTITCSEHLHVAIRASNLKKLRALVAPEKTIDIDNNLLVRQSVLTRQQINISLFFAVYKGCVEACRVLWKHGLGKRAKKMYTMLSSSSRITYPLHSAVCLARFDIVQLFIQEFRWNVNQTNGLGLTPLSCAINNVEM